MLTFGTKKEIMIPGTVAGYSYVVDVSAAQFDILIPQELQGASSYKAEFNFKARPAATDASGLRASLRPNNLTTNQKLIAVRASPGDATHVDTVSGGFPVTDTILWCASAYDDAWGPGEWSLQASVNAGVRRYKSSVNDARASSPQYLYSVEGNWYDTATTITFFRHFTSVGQFAVGSWVRLWAVFG